MIRWLQHHLMPLPHYYLTPARFMTEMQSQSMTGRPYSMDGSVMYMMKQSPQPEYIANNRINTMASYERATAQMRTLALRDATVTGFVAEYGVADGTSFVQLCDQAGQTVWGFDAFEGLEQGGRWRGNMLFQDQFQYGGRVPFRVPHRGKIVK